jgi:hypothetical protein
MRNQSRKESPQERSSHVDYELDEHTKRIR